MARRPTFTFHSAFKPEYLQEAKGAFLSFLDEQVDEAVESELATGDLEEWDSLGRGLSSDLDLALWAREVYHRTPTGRVAVGSPPNPPLPFRDLLFEKVEKTGARYTFAEVAETIVGGGLGSTYQIRWLPGIADLGVVIAREPQYLHEERDPEIEWELSGIPGIVVDPFTGGDLSVDDIILYYWGWLPRHVFDEMVEDSSWDYYFHAPGGSSFSGFIDVRGFLVWVPITDEIRKLLP
ncbi:MAG TPA: hypothetical protein EYO59_03315 [Chromatiaceae bacterium]|nr:hypothetical protein [Chromatiaceae bacterium]